MKTTEEIAGMVTIRNHLQILRAGSQIKKADYQTVNNLILQLDQDIVDSSIALFKGPKNEIKLEDELNISKKIAEAKAKLHNKPKTELVKLVEKQVKEPKIKKSIKKIGPARVINEDLNEEDGEFEPNSDHE